MVPNHMGIDSRWVIEHPDWFLQLPDSPYPAYSFTGGNLSDDDRVTIQIEDHYWDSTDAAVVFKRTDNWTGDARYIYHGNDGTSMPWNDTAQLDYLKPEVREAVIQTILHVARQFPIIRFDAAMTLARRHIQRLWYPEPGQGGAIPSRAEHGTPRAVFDERMPNEFWREVVDRVAARGAGHAAPGRGLLAAGGLLRPHPRHAPRLQQRLHEHAPRRGERQLPAGHQGHASSSTRRSSSASSTS